MVQFLFFLGQVPLSTAKEFTVNSTEDINDLEPGNGLCVAYLLVFPPFVLPYCTLRAAIEESNRLPGPDIINIPPGKYILELEGINEDMSSAGDLDITDALLIRGSGVDLTTVDAMALDRVIDIPNQNTAVRIEQLTITNGHLPSLQVSSQKGGGGIRNRGVLSLKNVAVTNNLVNGNGFDDAGGGILNYSRCNLTNSTVSENHAATGGGIYNSPGGDIAISSTTIYSNMSTNGGGLANEGTAKIINATISGNMSSSSGGGIYNASALNILQSTIANNSCQEKGGGISNEGTITLTNTILAYNSPHNCFLDTNINSSGNNIDDYNSCILDPERDFINTNPKLDRLQNHGGPTLTHGLYIGSPAVDAGKNLSSVGITTDQRGRKRPSGNAFDIGAFETKKRSVVPFSVPLLCCGNK